MPGSLSPRSTVTLSDSLQRRLNMYALAAGAAGVSVLALAQPGEGKIVYIPKHLQLPVNKKVFLDLNSHRSHNFYLQLVQAYNGDNEALAVTGVKKSNLVWGPKSYPQASALPAGVSVGPKSKDLNDNIGIMDRVAISTSETAGGRGPWKDVRNRYLGLKFSVGGKIHYGWARLTVHNVNQGQPDIAATLTGYAFETTPNKAIITGKTKGPDVMTMQPGSLGALAAGRNW